MITVITIQIIISGLLYLYYVVFLRNKPFHFFNRIYLLFATVISIATPFLHIPVVSNDMTSYSAKSIVAGFVSVNAVSYNASSRAFAANAFSSDYLLKAVIVMYALITLALLLRIAFAILRIALLLKTYATERRNNILLVKTNEKNAPFSFHKWLFWNNAVDIHSVMGMQIFQHESVHIRQKHSLDILFMEILISVFWINPFFWLIKKESRIVHEFLADDFVAESTDKALYAKLLLIQTIQSPSVTEHHFFSSPTLRRINMLAKKINNRSAFLRKIACIIVATTTILLLSFDIAKSTALEHVPVLHTNFMDKRTPSIPSETDSKTTKINKGVPSSVKKDEKYNQETLTKNITSLRNTAEGNTPLKPLKKQDEISILNYREGSASYSGPPSEDKAIPEFVSKRPPNTQVIFQLKNKEQESVFVPAKLYNEMVLIFNQNKEKPFDDDWRLQVRVYDNNANLLKEEMLKAEWITGFEAVKIVFDQLPKGNYQLQFSSSDNQYVSSCKLIKDF